VALERATFAGDRLSRRSLRRLLTRPTAHLVVVERGAVVGYALTLFRAASRSARLYSLAVDTACRGQGIGRALIAGSAATAARRGCRALNLEVRVDNRAALALYASLGFADRGERPNYYEDGTAARLLTLPLERKT
jgi:[ribosomal protein S18]-alanine N-acetyltransferase